MFCMGITELREEFSAGLRISGVGLGVSGVHILGLGGFRLRRKVVRSIGSCGSVTVKIFPGSFLVPS